MTKLEDDVETLIAEAKRYLEPQKYPSLISILERLTAALSAARQQLREAEAVIAKAKSVYSMQCDQEPMRGDYGIDGAYHAHHWWWTVLGPVLSTAPAAVLEADRARVRAEALRDAADDFVEQFFYVYPDGSTGHCLQRHNAVAVQRRLRARADGLVQK